EIMLISLGGIDADSWGMRLATLIVVGLLMTAVVYGAVALLVKMDDVGLWFIERKAAAAQALGRGLVKAMPWVFEALSVIGMVAMLWVGGHILLTNLAEVGVPGPFDLVLAIVQPLHDSAVLHWIAESALA